MQWHEACEKSLVKKAIRSDGESKYFIMLTGAAYVHDCKRGWRIADEKEEREVKTYEDWRPFCG
jgi:hypothetical protein